MSNIIIESPVFQEAKIVHNKDPKKAIFRMILQSAEEANQNKRIYPKVVLSEGMKNNEERMKRRAFGGELDHPTPMGNESFDGVRQTTVQLKETSHLIRDYEWNGNNLVGELETLSTPNGNILLGLLRDKYSIGISMRGMAELERRPDGINLVKAPLYIITFDSVSLPSHKSAVVDFNECKFESLNLLQESCGTICTSDGTCYLPNYFDKLVETKVIQFFNRWV